MSLEGVILDVKKMLIEVSNLPDLRPESIDTRTSLFAEGLGLDSIDVLELVVALDKRFGLKIKNDEKGRAVLQNVQTIAEAIIAKQAADLKPSPVSV